MADKELGFEHGELITNFRPEYRWSKHFNWIARFRCEPIPFTGKTRWSFGRYYRRPSHIRSRRLREEGNQEGFWTPKKGRGYIPDPWDDVPRERMKSWKKYRDTQYRPR